MVLGPKSTHSESEEKITPKGSINSQIEVDTFDGKLFVDWDQEASVTPLGQLPFFIEFLKLGRRFEPWVDECPLSYTSPNAPKKLMC